MKKLSVIEGDIYYNNPEYLLNLVQPQPGI